MISLENFKYTSDDATRDFAIQKVETTSDQAVARGS